MTINNQSIDLDARQILLKRGNALVSSSYVGPIGEITLDTTLQTLRIHNGVTPGGAVMPTEPVTRLWITDYLESNLAPVIAATVANIGIGNIASINLNGNSSNVLLGNGTWGTISTGNIDTTSLVNSNLSVTLNSSGTLTTPLLLPKTFTAVLDSEHMVQGIGLTDAPWEYEVSFQVGQDGTVNTMSDGNRIWFVNPGYVTGHDFEYTEADHGIPGYVLTITIAAIGQNQAGTYATLEFTQPPAYPSTVESLGAIKLTANNQSWVFGTDGRLTVPGDVYGSLGNFLHLDANGGTHLRLGTAEYQNIHLVTAFNASSREWVFNTDGSISYPENIKQSSKGRTVCPAGADTVVYTATGQLQHAIKLFVMIEGMTDGGGTSWDTQACDIIAVKGYNNNIVHITAYGVTYTGAAPLATFDGQWNATTNRIEITCRPNSTTTGVEVKVHAIEMKSND